MIVHDDNLLWSATAIASIWYDYVLYVICTCTCVDGIDRVLQGKPDSGEVIRYHNSFEGLLDVSRDLDSLKPRQAPHIRMRPETHRDVVHDLMLSLSLFSSRPRATATVMIPIAFETQCVPSVHAFTYQHMYTCT